MPKQTVSVTVRIDPDLWHRLQELARRNRRSGTKELEVAIEEHLQRKQEQDK